VRYYLKEPVSGPIRIRITDAYGEEIASLEGSNDPGINTVSWDMRQTLTAEEEAAYMALRSRDGDPTFSMAPLG
jgi:hypothetical protein